MAVLEQAVMVLSKICRARGSQSKPAVYMPAGSFICYEASRHMKLAAANALPAGEQT